MSGESTRNLTISEKRAGTEKRQARAREGHRHTSQKSKLAKDLFLATKGYLDCLVLSFIKAANEKMPPPKKRPKGQSKLAKKIFSQGSPRTPRRAARSQRGTDTVRGGAAVEREDERT